ncbi:MULTISPECIES: sugar O-acetyltransferase [unclassified Sphingobacterium]|jgi:maltose O-acetyltransferase|uniref:sugar O-acetyltransferase n=1 Tax=unclassified Sphingobacterium TaxID=2609468 RepID=UPI0025EE003A|nr:MULTISPECIES: sugar O-acetyltransferase [unclassified Sphingobacterium]MDF2475856.1 maltose O-acetyltransferase [Sphingobacterium sp.]
MKSPKEKMIAGIPYIDSDGQLFKERQYAKEELKRFNDSEPKQIKFRKQIIQKLFKSTGTRFFLEPPFRCDYGYNISIGENFYCNYNCTILDGAPVTIGENVLFGPNVSLFTAGHPIYFETRNQGWEFSAPIVIEDNVWIGGQVVINPGVHIGRNSVIGSGSVVTKDVPADVVAAGNPCRIIRSITAEDHLDYTLIPTV